MIRWRWSCQSRDESPLGNQTTLDGNQVRPVRPQDLLICGYFSSHVSANCASGFWASSSVLAWSISFKSAVTALSSFHGTNFRLLCTIMDNTQLDFGVGVLSRNSFRETLQAVYASDQNIVQASILELRQHREPKLGSLGFCQPHAQ